VALTASVALSGEPVTHPTMWQLKVDIRNDGDEAVRVSTATMLGSVSFEIVDADGRPVPLGPPPMPPSNLATGMTTIEPGGSLTLEFHGDELFPDAPAPGRYRLRFAARAPAVGDAWSGSIVSPWVPLDVSG